MKPYVTVNYFSGWWPEAQGSCKWLAADGHDWRPEYVSRIPLHGFYNSQETTDRDILCASAHGVDCFQMLWYPVDSPDTDVDQPHRVHLNEGIRFFMNSPYADRMQFMVEYCNHPPFAIVDREEWARSCALWAEMVAHPSHVKVDGRPLFKIHGLQFFYRQCGSDFATMGEYLDVLKAAIRKTTGKDPILSAGITGESPEFLAPFREYFDYFATYMDMPIYETEEDCPYEALGDFVLGVAERMGKAGVPFQPYLPVGWCPRPWGDPRTNFRIPTGEQFEAYASRMMDMLAQYPTLGINAGDQVIPAFSIYAWNEFGEGGYLAPTLIEGDQKLKGLARALDAHA